MTIRYLTTNSDDLDVIANYTNATQTVQLADGRYAFCDGQGGLYRTAKIMIPGYNYEYGQADASDEFTNAHAALGNPSQPLGARIVFANKLR